MKHTTAGSLSFWAWNDHLKPEVLLEQMETLRRAGYRGFFMHSREGLETPYLSEEWLSLCRLCAEAAREKGMEPYLYDEDKWPSGMAGGLVTRLHPEHAAKALVYIQERDCIEIRASQGHPWYSGSAPANNLSAESVRAYLDITHETYRKAFGGSLRGKVAGFFTDEPNFWDFFFNLGDEKRPSLPYTDDLFDQFRRRRGYDLDPRKLFFWEEGSARHRHDYWRTLSELFCERYTGQIHDWCRAQGVQLCGHLLFENDLGYQTRACGAAMPNYREMDVPGIDILGEQTKEYLTVKQCTSVAHQYGKADVISETYGCTGWDFTFEGQKRLWDFQAALGVTIRSQHLSFYSIRGLRKRDFPPAFSYQSESFRYNPVIEGYCSRLSAAMSEGTPHRPVLVIHTISGIWCRSGSCSDEDLTQFDDMGWLWPDLLALNRRGDALNRLAESLLKAGVDFDFGDEQLLARDGAVEEARLRLALAAYPVVVLPRTESIFCSTYDLLRQFAAAGGKLVVEGALPAMLEGVPAELEIPGAVFAEDAAAVVRLVEQWTRQPVTVTDLHTSRRADVLSVSRVTETGHTVAVVNDETPRTCRVAVGPGRLVEEENLLTGRRQMVPVDKAGGFYVQLERNDCRVYRLRDGAVTPMRLEPPYRHPHESEPLIAVLPAAVPFQRTMPNALTLDVCRWRMGDEAFSEPMQVFQAQREIRQRLGLRQIVGNGVEMRYLWIHDEAPTAPVTLRFTFQVDVVPEGDVYACLENAGAMTVTCNGCACTLTEDWFVDKDIRKVRLSGLKAGENLLELRCVYTNAMELEDIYLAGDFGVSADRHLTAEPKKLTLGDITRQGYYHYPGSIRYFYTFHSDTDRGELVLGDYRATLVIARIAGKPDVYLINGRRAELSLHVGENRLELEVVGSNRNLMGPFHHTYDGASRISWQDFRQEEGDRYTPEYLVKPLGLLSPVKILRLP